jgi:2-isopropylmalate synthase
LHSSAVLKNPATYEHVKPELVGNERIIPVSDQAGRSNVLARLAEAGIEIDAKDPRVARLLEDIKLRAISGYAYDGAEASFELLARRALGQVPDYFQVESFRVTVARTDGRTVSEGQVRLRVAGQEINSTGTGNGPVNALDAALRKDLGKYAPFIADLRLVDFKVRILNAGIEGGGTEAVTRVMVESADGAGNRWSTVGVSENIVDASFEALTDSITYKLYRDGARA